MAIDLTVNGVRHSVDVAPETPLLWVIRDQLGLTGTKFSCGIAQCGACTVHIDGRPVRSCSVPVSTVIGKAVTTIEGLSPDGTHPVQLAWIFCPRPPPQLARSLSASGCRSPLRPKSSIPQVLHGPPHPPSTRSTPGLSSRPTTR